MIRWPGFSDPVKHPIFRRDWKEAPLSSDRPMPSPVDALGETPSGNRNLPTYLRSLLAQGPTVILGGN
jgi:hypothetical protein